MDNTVYILDSYGLIFRCYFAFISHPLVNSRGENISALFGFFRNLHWILEHYHPNYLFAAMDSKTKTFRHEMYEQYKATRNKTPEDLHAQIPWIEDILSALGVPVLQCDGYEADDIIATVAKKCEKNGRQCRILSGDKDLMQLVTESTKILKPESGASTWKLTDSQAVKAEWGVEPSQLLDLLSLYGDSADNIPGVMGVGVKTAAKLLNEYKNLDEIYSHIDEIKGSLQKKLIDGKENAYFSQKLVRLNNEVPCNSIDDALNNPIKYDFLKAAQILNSYEAFNVAKSYAMLEKNEDDKKSDTGDRPQNVSISDEKGGEGLPLASNVVVSTSSTNTFSATPSSGGIPHDVLFSSNKESKTKLGSEVYNAPPITENDRSSYRAITKLSDLEIYISNYFDLCKSENAVENPPIAYDSETDDLNTLTCNIIGFSLCYEKQKAIYVPIQQKSLSLFDETEYIKLEDALNFLKNLFTNKKSNLVMHNAKFDLKVFLSQLKKICDEKEFEKSQSEILNCQLTDTMLLAWLESPERTSKNGYSLEYLCETKLGLKGIEFSEIVPKGQTFADVPLETAYKYAAEDADFTLQLFQKIVQTSQKSQKDFLSEPLCRLEHKILPILTKMELIGIHLDSEKLNSYNEELSKNLSIVMNNIYKEVGHEFNIASPKQLQTVLFEERHLKPSKKTKSGYSTDTSVLEELSYQDSVPKMILEYRELAKLQSTYVETLPKMADKNGRIHTDFVQTGTATGRLSCREPNLQNIPVRTEAGRRIRSAFTAPNGKVLISADYAQIELVVLAHLSGDKNMCDAFINGIDVHKATAAMIYGVSPDEVTPQMRRTAKTINFGVIYGMSAFSLAKDLGISRTEAQNFIEMYFRLYSSVSNFMTETVSKAEETGFVKTILGRTRPILNINSRNKVEKSAAERVAKNTPIQGSAADIVKMAMIKVSDALKDTNSPAKMLLQVHDELIFECPDDEKTILETIALIKDKMENAVKLNVPLRVSVEYGKNWGEFH